jgi:hypothetical protein
MPNQRRFWIACSLLLLLAFAFRFAVARYLPNDTPDDGKVYAQLARNMLEQHVFSDASEPPYEPTLIRLPGYPLFLAGVYSIFGHTNNTAVRIVQAVIDTASCVLIALLAFYAEPDEYQRRAVALAALAFAAVCPFSTIYTATILTETITIFLVLAMCLMATLAFRSATTKRSLLFWTLTGIISGLAVLFRPDSGLFAAAIGITLVGQTLLRRPDDQPKPSFISRLKVAVLTGAVFSLGFCLVLTPWTIRNWRLFHLFQPLAPAHAEMPGEFVPRGYLAWLRTWTEDQRYIGPVLWSLDQAPINIKEFPDYAFDSDQERDQVAALLKQYNQPPGSQPAASPETQPQPEPQASPSQPQAENSAQSATPEASPGDEAAEPQSGEEESEDDNEPDEPETAADEAGAVKMTPEIDQQFAQIARSRINHSKFRYYVLLPYKRAVSLWFDTHSQYYPFEGELLPLDDMDHTTHQHIWLPLFTALTWIYTLLGVAGAWVLWRSRDFAARRWVVLTALIVFSRLAFFASLENPEPRYVVEFFPFLCVLAGIATIHIIQAARTKAKVIIQG